MFNELQQLSADANLLALLDHYASLAGENREAWHTRMMEMEGTDDRRLAKLHGVLIASGWVEQDTGAVGCSYRITAAGQRALKRVRISLDLDEDEISSAEAA
jgi:hypothetical protein